MLNLFCFSKLFLTVEVSISYCIELSIICYGHITTISI